METGKQNKIKQPTEQDNLSSKRKILDAARADFARYGQAGARVDTIAHHAGVNKAMIYYHFDSKENLYLEVVKDLFSELSEHARSDISGNETLEELLGILVEIHTHLFTEVPDLKSIMFREMANPNPEVLERIAQLMGETGIPALITRLIVQGIESGDYRPIDIRQAMVAFITLSISYHIMHPIVDRVIGVEDHESFLNERKRVIVDLYLNGLKARQS